MRNLRTKLARQTVVSMLQTALSSFCHKASLLSPRLYHAATGRPTTPDSQYYQWLRKHYPGRRALADLRRSGRSAEGPLITVVMPVYNPPLDCLRDAIDSVCRQTYRRWQLCIVDDGSSNSAVLKVLREFCDREPRIALKVSTENGGISAATNAAIAMARGDFIAFLDHDDILPAHALQCVASYLQEHPETDVLYTDEDKCISPYQVESPFFKPDWCPDSLLSRMYTLHFAVYRRRILEELGGLRAEYDGAQDYDLMLRVSEKTESIHHLPTVLYHWRILPESIASGPSNPKASYAYAAAERALEDALSRRSAAAKVVPIAGLPCTFRVRYELAAEETVSILIASRDNAVLLERCLESIADRTTYRNYEIVLIDNGSRDPAVGALIARWCENGRFCSLRVDQSFNFSRLNNIAVEQSRGRFLLFLNDDTEVITGDWLEAMLEQAQRPSVGAVGALLLFPDGRIQHAGVLVGLGGLAAHSHRLLPASHPGYFGQAWLINNYSAVTGACLMCRRAVFDEVGGFDERFAVHYNDVDLCLRMGQKGYRSVYLPHVELLHHESSTIGKKEIEASAGTSRESSFSAEASLFAAKWKHVIAHDPCYSPHLTRTYSDYRIRVA